MEYRRIKDQDKNDAADDDIESSHGKAVSGSINNVAIVGASSGDRSKWKRK
nr:CMP-sialic acid transporter 4 [Ipomoea batatas]GMD82723.1 CMP-sialic acid transporter 4 [Ipomoea batatas]